MTEEEAVVILAIGFMVIVGIWLSALTYLVLRSAKKVEEEKIKETQKPEEETIPEEKEETKGPEEEPTGDEAKKEP
ncbi:MAG: hypothetical protein JSV56_12215 [Methanomassiliicoccales archaeon]|nr:MAG: hypothetical protein JSV56_12215 [Methanomassiliicoccales archaeon]